MHGPLVRKFHQALGSPPGRPGLPGLVPEVVGPPQGPLRQEAVSRGRGDPRWGVERKTAAASPIVIDIYRLFTDGSGGKESACTAGRAGFDPCVGQMPWRKEMVTLQ